MTSYVCVLKDLPESKREKASKHAIKLNPANAVSSFALATLTKKNGSSIATLARNVELGKLSLLANKYWSPQGGKFSVSFIERRVAPELRAKILQYMNVWSQCCNVEYYEVSTKGQVRIALRQGGGYASYMGTDNDHIPINQPTMWLDGFSLDTPESEYRRVIPHETGHHMGFPHEHSRKQIQDRLNRQTTIALFMRQQGWSEAEILRQVFPDLKESSVLGQEELFATSPPEETSVMCYYFPGSITKDGKPIAGGSYLTALDMAFAASVYPKPTVVTPTESTYLIKVIGGKIEFNGKPLN